MRKKLEDQLNIRLALIIPAILVLLLLLTLVFKKDSYSKEEGRSLETVPALDTVSILDGSYEKDLDQVISDKLIFRDIWLRIRTFSTTALGNQDINGIYKGRDGYLLERFVSPEEDVRKEVTGAISDFATAHPGVAVYTAIIPTSAEIMSAKLPLGAQSGDQQAFLQEIATDFEESSVKFIDVYKTLKNHKDENIYFRSDYNWSSLGAYYAYRNIGQEMNLDMSVDNFEAMRVSENFKGNLATASGLPCRADDINVYFPVDSDFAQVVEYDDKISTASPYMSEALTGNYKLDVFWGGDHSFIRINTSSVSKETLLVIKDSYGNNFIPFMMVNYREILVVDPEYYYGNINELMNEQTIDDVLILYSTGSLTKDSSLKNVLEGK